MVKKDTFLIVGVVVLFIAYLVLFTYVVIKSDHIDEAYKRYCDSHIELLEAYYQYHHSYPERLDSLDRREVDSHYLDKDCGCRQAKDSFVFLIPYGLGAAGYEPWKKKWWFD